MAALERIIREQSLALNDNGDDSSLAPLPTVHESGRATSVSSSSLEIRHDQNLPDSDLAGAVSVLEFLAWGRRKDQDLHKSAEVENGPSNALPTSKQVAGPVSFTGQARILQLELLQTLLPTKAVVFQMVDWHAKCLLWYHGSYNSVMFRKHLQDFYSRHRGNICAPDINMQWVALLFAILTASMTCSSNSVAGSWGFKSETERSKLSYQWYQATLTCLTLGDYLEVHKLCSVQAISTITLAAHTVGFSNSQSVLLASANRIAQSLGLHRLDTEAESTVPGSDQEIEARTLRETGRRVWVALCTQDWFSIPFSESYALNPDDFTTGKPLNCNENDLLCLPADTPTITSYCNYHYDIAALMPRLQVAINGSNTLYTKYEHVLAYDDKMRQQVTACMPTFLSAQSSVPPDWPVYVPWARRGLAICAAHKIMMIHRMFIGLSFTNNSFALTRRTCIAASKTILKEAQSATDEMGPVLWIDQAFVVAAAIILSLDALHRGTDDPQRVEDEKLTKEAVDYLTRFKLSMIATRGTRLITFLKEEISLTSRNRRKRTHSVADTGQPDRSSQHRNVDMPSLLERMSANIADDAHAQSSPQPAENLANFFADMFPPQTGFTFDNFFDTEYQIGVLQ